jgi:N6-L-threonylcarbamoyladenine synthase
MKILGIETSCDETAISLIEVDEKGETVKILGNTVHSQIDVHASYGGVFPILAKREHQRNLVPVLEKTLKEARLDEKIDSGSHQDDGKTIEKILEREPELLVMFKESLPNMAKPDIDYISVTHGPGLEPALWVGINFARALAVLWNIPLVPCNHMEGHILTALIKKENSNYSITKPIFPALSLLISGGHTQIVLVEKIGSYKIIGDTRDDAVGECFDKIARMISLPYPGGPKISKLSDEARKENIQSPEPLPRPMIDSKDLDFSFSGLKTAVLYLIKRLEEKGIALNETIKKGICREAEDAITEVIVAKMRKAIEKHGIETLIIGGGVIANKNIRFHLEKLASDCSVSLLLPQFDHATDNGLMIALAGYFNSAKTVDAKLSLKACGILPLGPRA